MKSEIIYGFLLVVILSGALPAEPPPSSETDRKVDSLFVIASSGELRFRDMVEPAIDSIAAMGKSAVPRLIEKYDTKDARERLTINNILVKIGKDAVPLLLKSLDDENAEKVSRICYTLGDIKDSSAVDELMRVAFHTDWRVRSSSCGALGKIGDGKAGATVVKSLADTVETVRKSAAVASGRLSAEDAIPVLVHMLGDSFYGARMCASEALIKFGGKALPAIADSLGSENAMLGNLGCITLGLIAGDSAAAILTGQLESTSATRRALAVEGIFLSNSSTACGAVELLAKIETDSTVLFYINKVIEKYASR
ncbi:MAG: HEAT repeat domain-containing protein [Candidatus Zixiibacteriota bacterium]|nr:MAG: HEAT repeat domain-containing protein [candidate division Zixibacteria bacterium]